MNHLKRVISCFRKWEFGKKLLLVDYTGFFILLICMIVFRDLDFTSVICAYLVQLGVAQGAYYWKAKCENRIKVPIKVIQSLPKDLRDQLDLTTIITAIIQAE